MTVSRASATRDWLVRFGRTVATTTVDAISARVTDTPVVADGSITLAGRPVQFDATPQPMALDHPRLGLPSGDTGQVLSVEELIAGSAFTLSRLTGAGGGIVDGTGGWGIWGAGAYGQFTGQSPEGYSVNGEVVSAFVGMDRAVARRLIGVAVSFNSGSGGYDDVDMGAGATGAGEILASLYSVHPYFRLELAEGLDVWGTVGAGVGNMQIDDDGGTFETEIRMAMGAAGSRYELTPTEGLDLALKTDALFAAMYAAATPGLPALKPYTTRLRLGLETSYDLLLGAGLRLAPSVEAGVRYDGGAAETGAGFDLGGGLQLVAPTIGMTIEGRGRMLLANWTDVGAVQWTIRDWGAAGLLQWAPGADGLGLTLSLAPSWGGAADVAPALWEQGALLAAAPGGAPNPAGRLAAEVGYGLAAFGRTSVLTPYGGVALAEAGARSYRAGIRFAVGQTVDLNLEGIRRQPASGTAEDVLHMQGQFRF